MFCICFSGFNNCLNLAWYESMPSSIDFACRSQGPEVPSMLRLPAGQGGKLNSTCWWSWTGFRDLYVTKALMLLCIFKSMETIKTYWDVRNRNRLDSNFKRRLGYPNARAGTMKPQEPLKVANFEWVWVGLVDGVMEQQHVHKVWLRTDHLSTKCHVSCRRWLEISLFGRDFGSKTAFCVQSDQLETSLFRCQILDVCIQDCVAAPSLLQPLVLVVATLLT